MDFDLPNEYLQSGVSIKITLDPNNDLGDTNQGNNTYPSSGYKTLGFVEEPTLKIRFIPFLVNGGDNSELNVEQIKSSMETISKPCTRIVQINSNLNI